MEIAKNALQKLDGDTEKLACIAFWRDVWIAKFKRVQYSLHGSAKLIILILLLLGCITFLLPLSTSKVI